VWCGVVSLFPEMFQAIQRFGVTGRAVSKGLVKLHYWNPRAFALDKHKTVDERPYGGGPGMVMQISPLREAIGQAKAAAEQNRPATKPKLIYVSPQGKPVTQARLAAALQETEAFIFVAGRYEGIDERIFALEPGEEWSIGDYVLSGGELAIMVIIDALSRLVPGVLGHEESAKEDSFTEGLLDCPHFTRPEVFEGLVVPEVLLSGNHDEIRKWRLKQRLGRTKLRRPELLDEHSLTEAEKRLLKEFMSEDKN